MLKTVLVLDRSYSFKYLKSDKLRVIAVALTSINKKRLQDEGIEVVGCFEEEYTLLPSTDYEDGYLDHSWDSDRFLRKYDFYKRREILGKEISFWNKVFDTCHPDCILNEIVTIEFMEVMYIEAQKRNIEYLMPIPTHMFPLTSWGKSAYNTRFSKEYWKRIPVYEGDLKEARVEIFNNKEKYQRPSYVPAKSISRLRLLKRDLTNYAYALYDVLKKKHKHQFIYEDYTQIHLNYVKMTFLRFLYKHDKFEPNSDVEYILYPLHYEPEAMVEYCGYHNNNQIALIGQIAHSLNTNQVLIIKEHPQQIGILLTKQFRKLKKRYNNILFMRGDISSYDVCKHISLLITLNGTIGYEFWMRQKPVVVLGDVFFSDFPGITQCSSIVQLHEIIRNKRYEFVEAATIEEYVAKVHHSFFKMNASLRASKEDITEMTKLVEKEIFKNEEK